MLVRGMKKPKKLKKPKLPAKLTKRPFKRGKSTEEKVTDALSNVPRITNDTVADHREEVLSSARKYIYPLQHSKHRVVRISIAILLAVIITFFVVIGLCLYKFQSTGAFIYDVTRIVPFPVAKAGSSWVSYESYLFELRRNMHYYKTQQQADFTTKEGKEQLKRLKEQALSQVVHDAYVKQLAKQHDVSVSNKEVDAQVALVRSQNRLGNNERVFREVLNEFWGWSEADFRRELKQQLLQQAVVAKLDTATHAKAESAETQLKNGTDFAALAGQISEDPTTKTNGGAYPEPLTASSRELPPRLMAEIFRLKQGETSQIINTGYTLDIAKVTEVTDSTRRAAHIQFNFQDINVYIKPVQEKNPGRQFIKL